MLLFDLVTTELERLDDEACEVWSRAELDIYSRDGYDLFARRTACIFDVTVIENTHPVGDVGSDLQRSLAEQTPGMAISDRRALITSSENQDEVREPVAAGDLVPITATVQEQATGPVPGGRLPDGTVAVLGVLWDDQPLVQETAQGLRTKDRAFETREGDPQCYLWGEDGLLFLRVWPAADGGAVYDEVEGVWGIESYTDDTATVDLEGGSGWGIPSCSDEFPSGGLWGLPTRLHPASNNIVVEIARLGLDPAIHDFEIPRTFLKYIGFYAMAQALRRDGPGQDMELAQHYLDRFELGITRMTERLRRLQPERRRQLGEGGGVAQNDMQISLPAWWGYARR